RPEEARCPERSRDCRTPRRGAGGKWPPRPRPGDGGADALGRGEAVEPSQEGGQGLRDVLPGKSVLAVIAWEASRSAIRKVGAVRRNRSIARATSSVAAMP